MVRQEQKSKKGKIIASNGRSLKTPHPVDRFGKLVYAAMKREGGHQTVRVGQLPTRLSPLCPYRHRHSFCCGVFGL